MSSESLVVYAVCGGWDYEGCSFSSLRLFRCRDEAFQYSELLCRSYADGGEGYDYAELEERVVS